MAENDALRGLIKKRYRTVRRFSQKAGLTESMVSHMLHGRKKIREWNRDNFARLLDIPAADYDKYFNEV